MLTLCSNKPPGWEALAYQMSNARMKFDIKLDFFLMHNSESYMDFIAVAHAFDTLLLMYQADI